MAQNKDLHALFNNTIQLVKSGNRQRAIELLSSYCDKQPDNAEIRREIGMFLQRNSMPFKAEMFYHDALRIDNNQPVIYFNLGVIYQGLNRVDEAASCYIQATKISPDYARPYANLAYLYKQTGDVEKCRHAALTAKQLEPEDPQISHMLAALGIDGTPEIADQSYIKNLYDDYASNYDQHLSVTLQSKVPELIYKTTMTHLNKNETDNILPPISILDLGCGTGLCGKLFHKHTKKITGVDLSEKMLSEAKKKDIYASLYASDITEYLIGTAEKYDIIISSDVLIYFGNLNYVFEGVSKALNDSGMFSFSVESLTNSTDDYMLNDSGRYKHNHQYIERLAKEHSFSMLSSDKTSLRKQNKKDVTGRIYALKMTPPEN